MVFGLKEGLVECATVYVKSVVILLTIQKDRIHYKKYSTGYDVDYRCCLIKWNSLGRNGNGGTYLFHETNQSYTEGPKLPFHSNYGCASAAFKSKFHGYRPVVITVTHGSKAVYLWDYTNKNDWETCKYTANVYRGLQGDQGSFLQYLQEKPYDNSRTSDYRETEWI